MLLPGRSEISVRVIVKHAKHIGIIRAFCQPLGGLVKFFRVWGTEKTTGLLIARGN